MQQSSDSKRAAMNEMMRAAEVAADENMSTMHLINHQWGLYCDQFLHHASIMINLSWVREVQKQQLGGSSA